MNSHFYIVLFGVFLTASVSFASDSTSQNEFTDTTAVELLESDSQKVQSTKANTVTKKTGGEQQQDTIASGASGGKEYDDSPAFLIQSRDDTLILIKGRRKDGEAAGPTESKGDEDSEGCEKRGSHIGPIDISRLMDRGAQTIAKSRVQGYGGGGGWTPGMMAFDLEPVVDLIRSDNILGKRRFPDLHDGYTPVIMSGWLGYGGLGNGVRIGGGRWSGLLSFSSAPYSAPDSADPDRKEVAMIGVEYSIGGLLLERSFVRDQFNFLTGGMISFGSIKVKRDFTSSANPSAFLNLWTNMDDTDVAKASLFGIELHGGFTYTVFPWVHLGADVNAFFAVSVNGFGAPGLKSFLVASPGIRLRIILGNIG